MSQFEGDMALAGSGWLILMDPRCELAGVTYAGLVTRRSMRCVLRVVAGLRLELEREVASRAVVVRVLRFRSRM
jgi:hypothetical protein